MKTIPLPQGAVALVDDDAFELLNQHKWHRSHSGKGYVVRWSSRSGGKKRHYIFMHKIVMNSSKGSEVDHVSRDKTDNRKQNLRHCTSSQNKCNRPAQSNNKLKIKGVDFHQGAFRANIQIHHKRKFLGYFDTPVEAANAYANAAREMHGQFARLTA